MPSRRRPTRSANADAGRELEAVEVLTRKVELLWPAPTDRARALTLLSGCPNYELTRVKLAVLKLSEGKLEELARYVAAARLDYRDVLLWAEYPNSAQAGAPRQSDDAEAQARRLRARKLDTEQYQAWLKKR